MKQWQWLGENLGAINLILTAVLVGVYIFTAVYWLGGLGSDVEHLQDDMTEVKNDLKALRKETDSKINGLSNELADVKSDVAVLKSDVATLKDDMAIVKADIKLILATVGNKSTASDASTQPESHTVSQTPATFDYATAVDW